MRMNLLKFDELEKALLIDSCYFFIHFLNLSLLKFNFSGHRLGLRNGLNKKSNYYKNVKS